MNCKSAQEIIIDAMASRAGELRGELHQHVRECAKCSAFLANQASLSTAIDSYLRLVASEPVPASLLPGVRPRLEQEAAPRRWIFGRQFAAVAAAIVLLAALGVRMRNSNKPERPTESAAQVAPETPNVSPQVQQLARKTSRVLRKASVRAHSSASEVLILPEEQQAFRCFVSDVSKDRASANAPISAAPDGGDVPVEIALLTIEKVEVKPLEGTDSE